MKLDNYTKMQLRKHIVEQLKNVPEGQRIHLDKELLEELLFERVYKDKIKLPFWCGEFLSKIDLSEISFEDVSWNLLSQSNYAKSREKLMPYINLLFGNIDLNDYFDIADGRLGSFEYEIGSLIDNFSAYNYYVSNYRGIDICYSNTNANIDFTKSFEAKNGLGIRVTDCSFSGMDFSNFDINLFDSLDGVNFSNTGIKVSDMEKFINKNYTFVELANVDLSHISIDYDVILSIYKNSYIGLKGTKLNIVGRNDQEIYELNDDCFMDGCYFNGKFVNYDGELFQTTNENSKVDLFDTITESIEEQKKSFRR